MLNVELEYKQVIAPMGTRLLFSLQVCATFFACVFDNDYTIIPRSFPQPRAAIDRRNISIISSWNLKTFSCFQKTIQKKKFFPMSPPPPLIYL